MPLPLTWKPERGSAQAYERVREGSNPGLRQSIGQVLHELLPVVPGFGVSILPAPSAGDVFFDLEGDRSRATAGLSIIRAMRF